MSKQLTTEELQQVKDLRQEYTNLAYALGEVELQKASLLETQKELVAKEKQIAKHLQDKYGTGSIDLETGEVKS